VKLARGLGLAVLAACSQSYEDGVRMVCEAPTHCTDRDPASAPPCAAEWLRDHLKNDEVRGQLGAMAASAGNKADALAAC
jgi:hypothetical protein